MWERGMKDGAASAANHFKHVSSSNETPVFGTTTAERETGSAQGPDTLAK